MASLSPLISALASFHPATQAWFSQSIGTPSPVQQAGWPQIAHGGHVLLAAPTGSGKTLAAFLAAIDALMVQAAAGTLSQRVHVLYISPLKALSADVHKNLQAPLAGIAQAMHERTGEMPVVRAACRTGDTPQAERQRILKKPPHILVTTPESLYLLLGCASGQHLLQHVKTVIVDEVHALANNRRGSHLSLSLEHLSEIALGPIQRIGLSATQNPMVEVARFLVGMENILADGTPRCALVDVTQPPDVDVQLVLPSAPLEAIMATEVWQEVYGQLVQLIESHTTTLIFVNTRRMAERLAFCLGERLGSEKVVAHHGSLAGHVRHEAEQRLKSGDLKALVATGSLELGIDMGPIDLVCQVGTVRTIATFVQRIGRANHHQGGQPKGRLFPLTRDELVECTALIQCLRQGTLDVLIIPVAPLDILAQHLVARCGAQALGTTAKSVLLAWVRKAYPYRDVSAATFDSVLTMVTEGYNTRRGRRGALLHYDAVNAQVRPRKGAQLAALTCGGAIADTGDFKVMLMPQEMMVGTVNEEFAVDSQVGDVFVLGSMHWRILGVSGGAVRVQDAGDTPPSVPFWFGESPSRSAALSAAVSTLRRQVAQQIGSPQVAINALCADPALPPVAMAQLVAYLHATQHALGCMPHDGCIVAERFFDDAGGMQLVLHSPLGSRLNRAWGLALRKRFCKSFNFELQAAATEDAIVLSLGEVHAFELSDVFRFLHRNTVRHVLIQALLDAPMFQTRWRWNAGRSLAVLRMWCGKRVPPQVLRMQAEDLVAAVFPDQIACAENIQGERQVPDHPLVNQTIGDCLQEAMDIDALEDLLDRLADGTLPFVAVDTPEPSAACHEILVARPYAFLDDGDAEERRTQAVFVRRTLRGADEPGAEGRISAEALAQVHQEAWPKATDADGVHDALMTMVWCPNVDGMGRSPHWPPLMQQLQDAGRALAVTLPGPVHGWVCTEHYPVLLAAYGQFMHTQHAPTEKAAELLAALPLPCIDKAQAALVGGQLQVLGPVTVQELATRLGQDTCDIEAALLGLEGQGMAMRGAFRTVALRKDIRPEWCARRLVARMHRLTVQTRRRGVKSVSQAVYARFIWAWQGVGPTPERQGLAGLKETLLQLGGLELPAAAWEADILPARIAHMVPSMLDTLCTTGEMGWGRISAPMASTSPKKPLGASPMACMAREDAWAWRRLPQPDSMVAEPALPASQTVWQLLQQRGAMFFLELVRATDLPPVTLATALAELAALGLVASDSFAGLRALLAATRALKGKTLRGRSYARPILHIERAGRWSLSAASSGAPAQTDVRSTDAQQAMGIQVRTLLKRYGVVTYRLLAQEKTLGNWRDMLILLRRMEMRGEVLGGHFIAGLSGEQFALPEAVRQLKAIADRPAPGTLQIISAADPLNMTGVLGAGPKVARRRKDKLICRDGVPVAWWHKAQLQRLQPDAATDYQLLEALALSQTAKGISAPAQL